MKKLGRERSSFKYWQELSADYADELKGGYHKHRLSVIDALIPKKLFSRGKRIFDFGCGDAVHFPAFLKSGAEISGVDIAPEMVSLARDRLSKNNCNPAIVSLGGSAALKGIKTGSLDAILSFNVLAYLTKKEEEIFYKHAGRTIKRGGFLIVTHSNELFDLFSLNRYTVNFFSEYLMSSRYKKKIRILLKNADKPKCPVLYNIRENPLTYGKKLKKYGFCEIRQEFINHHNAPPALLSEDKAYPDTLSVTDNDRWKLIFTCSTFGSCAIKE